jgi:hypothetical protein
MRSVSEKLVHRHLHMLILLSALLLDLVLAVIAMDMSVVVQLLSWCAQMLVWHNANHQWPVLGARADCLRPAALLSAAEFRRRSVPTICASPMTNWFSRSSTCSCCSRLEVKTVI